MVTRSIRYLPLAVGAGIAAYALTVRPWLLRWGSTENEQRMQLPGDELLPEAKYQTTHAINIDAPAALVWPWVIQIGQGRGGFYSYDWLENLIGLDIHSAESIQPELQMLRAGDTISLAPEEGLPLVVEVLDPPYAMVLRTGEPGEHVQPGDYLKGEVAGTWAFILEPLGTENTRLIIRWRSDWEESPLASIANLIMLEAPHCIMERKMLLGIKERAEQHCARAGKSHAVAA